MSFSFSVSTGFALSPIPSHETHKITNSSNVFLSYLLCMRSDEWSVQFKLTNKYKWQMVYLNEIIQIQSIEIVKVLHLHCEGAELVILHSGEVN